MFRVWRFFAKSPCKWARWERSLYIGRNLQWWIRQNWTQQVTRKQDTKWVFPRQTIRFHGVRSHPGLNKSIPVALMSGHIMLEPGKNHLVKLLHLIIDPEKTNGCHQMFDAKLSTDRCEQLRNELRSIVSQLMLRSNIQDGSMVNKNTRSLRACYFNDKNCPVILVYQSVSTKSYWMLEPFLCGGPSISMAIKSNTH